MDSRLTFVGLFIENNCPIYYDDRASSGVRRVCQYWRSLGYKVEKSNGDKKAKYLYFYKSRFISKARNSDDRLEYIIVPSLKNPRWIILNQKNVISKHGLIIKPTSVKARFVWGLAKILNRFNLFALVFPDRFVAKRSQMAVTIFSKKGYIPSILYTGAPGKYQKFTIQYNDKHCNPAYYLKIANLSGGTDRIVSESKALEKINCFELEFIKTPRIIEVVRRNGFYGSVQNNILSNENISILLSEVDILAISELYNRFGFQEVCLSEYLSGIGFQECAEELSMLVDYFESIKEKKIFLVISHGDYIPWNRFVSLNQVKVIDWEMLNYRPLFYDVCYFLMHKAILVEKSDVMSAVNESASCINDLLPNINNSTAWIETVDVEFYILINLVELYLHYKSNNHAVNREFLRNLRNGIIELQKQQLV